MSLPIEHMLGLQTGRIYDGSDQLIADQKLLDDAGICVVMSLPLTEAQRAHMRRLIADREEVEAEAARRKSAAKKDAAMLGDSGYERVEADHYCTPPENVNCLLQHITLHENVWECAAGTGNISERLIEFGHKVWNTDIIDYGYDKHFQLGSFLDQTKLPDPSIRAIVTNPPYLDDLPEQFIRHALKLMQPVKGQVAMFLRNEYDCSKGRMPLFGLPPFHKKIIVTKRPRWVEGSTGSPRHNYSWFCWDFRHKSGPASVAYAHPSFSPTPAERNTHD